MSSKDAYDLMAEAKVILLSLLGLMVAVFLGTIAFLIWVSEFLK